jgi:hypothetical protein
MEADNGVSIINLFLFAVGLAFLLVECATYGVRSWDAFQERKRIKELKAARDKAILKAIGSARGNLKQ